MGWALHDIFHMHFAQEMVYVVLTTVVNILIVDLGDAEQEDGTAPPSFVTTHLAALWAEGIPTQDDIDDIMGHGNDLCR
jgi:hypothetical protein